MRSKHALQIGCNCVEIVRSTTAVDVRWQDGTLTTGEPARTLVPILPDGTDFQAGDFVTEKSDEDPSAAAGEQNASAALTRTGIIRSVNARERTCAVSWAAGPGTGSQDAPDGSAAPPAVSFAEAVDGEFSVYELVPHPDFSFRMSCQPLEQFLPGKTGSTKDSNLNHQARTC